MKVSLLVGTTARVANYFNLLKENINSLYKKEIENGEVELIVDADEDTTIGMKYNSMAKRATGDILVLIHDDMVLHPGFVENILKYSKEKQLIFYVRVEPPVFLDPCPGKIVENFGFTPTDFNKEKFFNYNLEDKLIDIPVERTGMFMSMMKKDFIGFDTKSFERFAEDWDINLRYKMLDFEIKLSTAAIVYHFVSRTSRTDEKYKTMAVQPDINFYNKWGFTMNDSGNINIEFLKNTKSHLIYNI